MQTQITWSRGQRGRQWLLGRFARASAALLSIAFIAGCDLGTDQSANRFEQLNTSTKQLINILRQISDEESAKAHLAELEAVAGEIRDIQAGIEERARENKDPAGSLIVNHRQSSLYVQAANNVANRLKQIREADEKAGDIVDKALEGLNFE